MVAAPACRSGYATKARLQDLLSAELSPAVESAINLEVGSRGTTNIDGLGGLLGLVDPPAACTASRLTRLPHDSPDARRTSLDPQPGSPKGDRGGHCRQEHQVAIDRHQM